MVVYVDDFSMSGPDATIAKGWDLVRKGVTLGEVEPLGLFLGCDRQIHEVPCKDAPNGKIRIME